MRPVTCETAGTRACPFMSRPTEKHDEIINCLSGGCMAWRAVGVNADGKEIGYCGAAGPIEPAGFAATHAQAVTRALLNISGELRVVAGALHGAPDT